MNDFEEYVSTEFKVDNKAAIDVKYTHSVALKVAKNKTITRDHIIKVIVKVYDKKMKLLKTGTFKFINNLLCPQCAKKLVNVNEGEMNNKFMAARNEIIKTLNKEYMEKIMEFKDKSNLLDEYSGKTLDKVGIPDKFKGELVKVVNEVPDPKINHKKKYDM